MEKDFEILMTTTMVEGRWRINLQAMVRSAGAADTLIAVLGVAKQILAQNEPPDTSPKGVR